MSDAGRRLELEVTFDDDDFVAMGLTEELTPEGLFVATGRPRPVGSTVTLSFLLPDSKKRIEAVVEVLAVRCGDAEGGVAPGMSVAFHRPHDQGAADVRALLLAGGVVF